MWSAGPAASAVPATSARLTAKPASGSAAREVYFLVRMIISIALEHQGVGVEGDDGDVALAGR